MRPCALLHHARSNKLEEQALASSVVREFQLARSGEHVGHYIRYTPYQQAYSVGRLHRDTKFSVHMTVPGYGVPN
jgi:hypothetical protein